MDLTSLRQRIHELLAEQRRLVQSLLRQREQLTGSLFVRYAECGKEGCPCRHGAKHGPYYVLSTRTRGKGACSYLDRRQLPAARSLLKQYRAFRSGLRRLRKVNTDLVGQLRRYQNLSARRGVRRLGLSVQV